MGIFCRFFCCGRVSLHTSYLDVTRVGWSTLRVVKSSTRYPWARVRNCGAQWCPRLDHEYGRPFAPWGRIKAWSSPPVQQVSFQSQRSTMKFTIATTFLPLFLAHQAVGICPGFNFGIGNAQGLGNGINRCKCYTLPLTVNNDDRLLTALFSFSHRECL